MPAKPLPVARQKLLMLPKVKKSTALAIIKQVGPEVEAKMTLAGGLAETRLRDVLTNAEQGMREVLGGELDRLTALRSLNPSIRQVELDHIKNQINECAIHIQHANLQMQALRLIITN